MLLKNSITSLKLHALKLYTTGLEMSESNLCVVMERIKSKAGDKNQLTV